MKPQRITSPFLRGFIAIFCAMWTVSGWYIFLTGSFSTSPRRSNVSTTVEGVGAQFIGIVFVILGLLALVLLLQSFAQRISVQLLGAVLWLVVPPLVLQAWLA